MEAEILEATTQELMMHDYPSDCCPEGCYLRFPCLAGDPDSPFWQGWGNLRIKTFRLIENKYFEMAVITMILISSLALVSMYLYLLMYLGFIQILHQYITLHNTLPKASKVFFSKKRFILKCSRKIFWFKIREKIFLNNRYVITKQVGFLCSIARH